MKKHMKRLVAPRSWGVQRKGSSWVSRPRPGPHAVGECVPMLTLLRDMLGICDTGREAKFILGSREVLVDGRVVTDPKFPVGFMDVVSLPKTGDNYRMLLNSHGRFKLTTITKEQAKAKLVRIENQSTVKTGKFQINLHDGRNILMDKKKYKTGDVLKIELPSQKIMKHITLKEGGLALLIGGSHPGALVTVQSFEVKRGSSQNLISFKEGFATVKDHVFIVGGKTPEVKLLEADAT